MRRHHWAILAAILVALVVWLARPRKAGEPPVVDQKQESAQRSTEKPASQNLALQHLRQAAAEKVAEERRHHDQVAAAIHQAQTARSQTSVLDGPYIKERIHELQPLINECYELALREHPNLEGRLVLSFAIVGEPTLGGVVESLQFVSDGGIADTNLQECVRATLETQTFAPPQNGGRVQVTYPFVFSR
jgi:hypothetical protein